LDNVLRVAITDVEEDASYEARIASEGERSTSISSRRNV
jgi:hypothetical protein